MFKQTKKELLNALTPKNLIVFVSIILIVPFIQFLIVYDSYEFYKPIEVFEESISTIPGMTFPILALFIYVPSFISEYRHNFLIYTRTRVNLHDYLISKGIVNALLSGIVMFLMIFITYLLVQYIEPLFGLVSYSPINESTVDVRNTFSSFIGDPFLYATIYALWIGVNAALYATLTYILVLSLQHIFVAISLPFFGYHLLNFVSGIFQVPKFSPLSTLFPFNLTSQPIWTVCVPFVSILLMNIILYKLFLSKREEWSFH